MRVTLLLFLLLLYFLPARTQVLSVQQLLTATSMAPHKAENFIGQKGFIFFRRPGAKRYDSQELCFPGKEAFKG